MSRWLCPFLYLKRPINLKGTKFADLRFRLDNVLKKAAQRGVKIFIILWEEPTRYLLYQSSAFVASTLRQLDNKNIKIMKHSSWFKISQSMTFSQTVPLFWSHHQKIVIIDEKTAFLGGLDLCYGRWDTNEHRLVDPLGLFHPYMDYSNARIADYTADQISSKEKIMEDVLNREKQHRLPWHDIQIKIEGLSVYDLCCHFLAQWKHVTSREEIVVEEINSSLTESCKKKQMKLLTQTLGIKKEKQEDLEPERPKFRQSISRLSQTESIIPWNSFVSSNSGLVGLVFVVICILMSYFFEDSIDFFSK